MVKVNDRMFRSQFMQKRAGMARPDVMPFLYGSGITLFGEGLTLFGGAASPKNKMLMEKNQRAKRRFDKGKKSKQVEYMLQPMLAPSRRQMQKMSQGGGFFDSIKKFGSDLFSKGKKVVGDVFEKGKKRGKEFAKDTLESATSVGKEFGKEALRKGTEGIISGELLGVDNAKEFAKSQFSAASTVAKAEADKARKRGQEELTGLATDILSGGGRGPRGAFRTPPNRGQLKLIDAQARAAPNSVPMALGGRLANPDRQLNHSITSQDDRIRAMILGKEKKKKKKGGAMKSQKMKKDRYGKKKQIKSKRGGGMIVI